MFEAPEFSGDHVMRIGLTDFHYDVPADGSESDHLRIAKPRVLLEAYIELWGSLQPQRVVELGVWQGGSTAMLCELGGLARLVAIELSDTQLEGLRRYISERGLGDVVRPYYGVDQADRGRLGQIVGDEFDDPLDLVIDDASHLYGPSRASFEVLFPRLRPGGIYLLEDWGWAHILSARLAASLSRDPDFEREIEEHMTADARSAADTPMSRLVLELVIARAISGDVVEEVVVGPYWAAVRRGAAALEPDSFRLDHYAPDHLDLLTPIH